MMYIVFVINALVIIFSGVVALLGLHDLDNGCIIMCLLATTMNLVCSFKL